jgi:CheY-like chemotaxis protein
LEVGVVATDPVIKTCVNPRRSRSAQALSRQRRSPRVVCIDDDPDFLGVLERLVGSLGVRVETAPDAVQGYRAVLRARPDLVITDYFLPHEYGSYLLRRLKQFAFTSRVPVVVVTGRDLRADVSPPRAISLEVRLKELGADAVYNKPLGESLLRAIVYHYLS